MQGLSLKSLKHHVALQVIMINISAMIMIIFAAPGSHHGWWHGLCGCLHWQVCGTPVIYIASRGSSQG